MTGPDTQPPARDHGAEPAGAIRLVELNHVVEDGMVTYPGLPGPQLGIHLSREASRAAYAPGTEFEIGRITMVANTGTYLDTPLHRFEGGQDLADVALEKVAALPGVMIDLRGSTGRGIDPDAFGAVDVHGRAVLLQTGWSRFWRTDRYAVDAPFLSATGAEWLVARGAALVGIDSINIDDVADGRRPAHTALLAAGIPILEHLTGLDPLPRNGFSLHAAPVRVRGMGTFPVRAYAVLPAVEDHTR
jgi:kynurenine formamidase